MYYLIEFLYKFCVVGSIFIFIWELRKIGVKLYVLVLFKDNKKLGWDLSLGFLDIKICLFNYFSNFVWLECWGWGGGRGRMVRDVSSKGDFYFEGFSEFLKDFK